MSIRVRAYSGFMAVQEVLTAALASEWTPKQALILDRTEDVESVVDAVQRVATQLPQVQLCDYDMTSSCLPETATDQAMTSCQDVLTDWTQKAQGDSVNSLVLAVQGDAADDVGEEEAGPAKKESKLASFTWASKLSDTSSSGASALQPGLLQSLTGTIAGPVACTDGVVGLLETSSLPVTSPQMLWAMSCTVQLQMNAS